MFFSPFLLFDLLLRVVTIAMLDERHCARVAREMKAESRGCKRGA